ncbi:MAG: hypothetical protein Q4G45_04805 [Actinomycetia bacterium]|nr:hypothetical protein [Actinomycetes bacterium]
MILGSESDKGFVQVAGWFTGRFYPQVVSAETVTWRTVGDERARMLTDARFTSSTSPGPWCLGVTSPWDDEILRKAAAGWACALRDLLGHPSPDELAYYAWRYLLRLSTPYGEQVVRGTDDEVPGPGLRYLRPEGSR